MKLKLKILATFGLCASALTSLADPPSSAINPRNAVLFSGQIVSNAVPLTTNINAFTNIILTALYQHGMSVTTIINATNAGVGGTNTTGSGAFAYTNYFDLGKITNSGGVSGTNWTTDAPIIVTGTGNGLSPVVQARELASTNFDSYELMRLTKFSSNATNSYWYQIILGQTP